MKVPDARPARKWNAAVQSHILACGFKISWAKKEVVEMKVAVHLFDLDEVF